MMARWVRVRRDGGPVYGVLDGATIALHDGMPWGAPVATGEVIPAGDAVLLAPVRPLNFLGLWNNFHAAATKQGNAIPGEPLYFLKSVGAILDPDGEIVPPASYAGRVLFEAELGVVIGRSCRAVDEAEAAAAIFGYTCVNDVTAMDLLNVDPSFAQWARAKGCDTFGPVGPAIATGLDWRTLTIRARLGGRERQNYPAADMILSPPAIVSLISREMTLHPGDLIACGTSVGALPMRAGMAIEVEIDGIGVLRNRMAA